MGGSGSGLCWSVDCTAVEAAVGFADRAIALRYTSVGLKLVASVALLSSLAGARDLQDS